MSTVTLILVHGSSIMYVQAHWRTIKALLEHGFEGISWKKRNWVDELDAGYILVDLNTGFVLNEQNAFALQGM
ncbi:MAG TPA: hypothetical protein VLJ21_01770 [Candidatus Binatia bacterium]|nr:hypothetical protein [Candidatus Binatia bacterium]